MASATYRPAGAKRPDFRLLALDIDGTLYTSRRTVSARTHAAIAAAQRAGVRVVLATGHGWRSAARIAGDLGCASIVVVGAQGAVIWEDGRIIRYRPLTIAAARRALDHSLAESVPAVVRLDVAGDHLFLAGPWETNERLRALARRPHNPAAPYDSAALTLEPREVVMVDGAVRLGRVYARLQGDPAAPNLWRPIFNEAAPPSTSSIQVIHRDANKGAGLCFLCQRYGLRREQVLAFGDGTNDVEMLDFAGLGVAMGNAHPEACAAANLLTASNDQDGIALVLEDLGLAPAWMHAHTAVRSTKGA